MKTLLLIDANSLIHRAFHALPPFTDKSGRPTGALYGVASVLLKIWREEKPDYAAVLFDRPEPTFRKIEYAEYKAQRPPAPNELISQIIEAHELFTKFGIKVFEYPGFEADDLIATLATKFGSKKDTKIVILTGDKDTLQLVEGDKVVVETFKKGVSETVVYDESAVRERYGLEPRQLVDYKALVGDASDNIKGVPGVGPKTASELLKKYDTLEKIYENLDSDPKLRERLGQWQKEAELSKQLVLLEKHVPVEVKSISELEVPDRSRELRDYFKSLGFETLIKRLSGESGGAPKKEEPKAKAQNSMF